MDSEALKPCPFCGSTDLIVKPWHGGGPAKRLIGCCDCEVGPYATGEYLDEAITAWNTRADANTIEALQAENAKLRDALFPFAEFHQLGGSMNDPISMWFRVAPFADAAYALQETER